MPIPPVVSLRYICMYRYIHVFVHTRSRPIGCAIGLLQGTTDYFNENILFRKVHSNRYELYIKRTSVNSDG